MLFVSLYVIMWICSFFPLLFLFPLSSSAVLHEGVYFVGCFENGTTEILFDFDADEFFYVDFERHEVVFSIPSFLWIDPGETIDTVRVYKNALKGKNVCTAVIEFLKVEEKHPPEERDPPESIVYPAEEAQLGVENTLICFVNHFYPPDIRINWTKNDQPVLEGVSLSRYSPNNDGTFHQFSTLTFTPREGDIYSCTVEHSALSRPMTKIWEPEVNHPSVGADIFCGVGLTLGLLGVAAGTFVMVKGHQGH